MFGKYCSYRFGILIQFSSNQMNGKSHGFCLTENQITKYFFGPEVYFLGGRKWDLKSHPVIPPYLIATSCKKGVWHLQPMLYNSRSYHSVKTQFGSRVYGELLSCWYNSVPLTLLHCFDWGECCGCYSHRKLATPTHTHSQHEEIVHIL